MYIEIEIDIEIETDMYETSHISGSPVEIGRCAFHCSFRACTSNRVGISSKRRKAVSIE